ncbi:hypothetical protein HYH03_002384 [Edaphochlamys debaryana]|uniref:3-hydroxyisobutyrate dehydrogenase n=1 Tax=Edaphochlamys debaryana TaxID=47281 RepID=A0A836C569_9CHLO|nr:hypothetical protein HYH03_002384 [Edaphochlamys debaryana]|eukprot:KAG2499437.1 hypothetical protein HYH03_002384 [Edaphochlamys debaryana]
MLTPVFALSRLAGASSLALSQGLTRPLAAVAARRLHTSPSAADGQAPSPSPSFYAHPHPRVGFVGLGALGSPMARRLLAAGHRLAVYDSDPAAAAALAEEAEALGAPGGGGVEGVEGDGGGGPRVEVARGLSQLARTPGLTVLFTVLSGPEASRAVYTGPGGLLAGEGGVSPRIMVDCTTLDPPTARELAGRVRAARVDPGLAGLPPLQGRGRGEGEGQGRGEGPCSPCLLDAPVSGGVQAAETGCLSFLVGGDPSALPPLRPLLGAMGRSVLHCGEAGDGAAARLCNSLVTASVMAATAEALALGRRLGVDPGVLTEVLNSGSGRSWASDTANPVPGVCPAAPASRGYRGGLRCAQLLQHLALAARAAGGAHSPLPMGARAMELYQQVVDQGQGDADFSVLYRHVYGSGGRSSGPDSGWRRDEARGAEAGLP